MGAEIQNILEDIKTIRGVYQKLFQFLPLFDGTDKSVLPYGLKPHTRSVSWLVEQVITQQTKFRKEDVGSVRFAITPK